MKYFRTKQLCGHERDVRGSGVDHLKILCTGTRCKRALAGMVVWARAGRLG